MKIQILSVFYIVYMKKNIIYFVSVNLFLLLVLLGLFRRIHIAEKQLGSYTDCHGCYDTLVMRYDAWIIALILACFCLSYYFKSSIIILFLRLSALFFLSLYFLDIYLLQTLSHRLTLEHISKYGNLNSIKVFLQQPFSTLMVGVSIFLISWAFFLLFGINPKKSAKLFKLLRYYSLSAFLLSLLLFSSYLKTNDYIRTDLVQNYLYTLFFFGEREGYSERFIENQAKYIPQYYKEICFDDGLNEQKNIILVIVESLSAYHSQFMSGLNNWTPHIDDLARNHIYYPNFFANSYSSAYGRVSIFSGDIPFDLKLIDYGNTYQSIPKILQANNYHSALLSASNLDFLESQKFFQAIGFDYIEDDKYVGYQGLTRYSFNSVSDEVLYNRGIDYIKNKKQPYFLTLITASTHAPYITPVNKKGNIIKSFNYADQALFNFYQGLQAQNFFENGILIITSDHRAMTPILQQEKDLLGVYAKSRIPLIIVDGRKNFVDKRFLQQADLPASMKYLTQKRYCLRSHEHNLFKSVNPNACVYHVEGLTHNKVEVFCNNGKNNGVILLKGDHTHIISGNLKNPSYHTNWVNTNRIDAILRKRAYLQEHRTD